MKNILFTFILITAFCFSDTGELSEDFINEINKEASKIQVEDINKEIKPFSVKREYKLRLISPIASKKGEVYNREYMYYSFYENINSDLHIDFPSSTIKIERK